MVPRTTIPTQLVLRVLLADPEAERHGYQLGEAAGLARAHRPRPGFTPWPAAHPS